MRPPRLDLVAYGVLVAPLLVVFAAARGGRDGDETAALRRRTSGRSDGTDDATTRREA